MSHKCKVGRARHALLLREYGEELVNEMEDHAQEDGYITAIDSPEHDKDQESK